MKLCSAAPLPDRNLRLLIFEVVGTLILRALPPPFKLRMGTPPAVTPRTRANRRIRSTPTGQISRQEAPKRRDSPPGCQRKGRAAVGSPYRN